MRKTPKYLKRFSAIAAAMSASLVASSAMAAPTVAAEGAVVMSIQQVMEAINNGCQVSLVGPTGAQGALLLHIIAKKVQLTRKLPPSGMEPLPPRVQVLAHRHSILLKYRTRVEDRPHRLPLPTAIGLKYRRRCNCLGAGMQ